MCCVSIDSISLRLHRRLNHIIVSSHRMFTPTGRLLGLMWGEGVIYIYIYIYI